MPLQQQGNAHKLIQLHKLMTGMYCSSTDFTTDKHMTDTMGPLAERAVGKKENTASHPGVPKSR